jgi:DNA-binding NarL/FixJ family response regulator
MLKSLDKLNLAKKQLHRSSTTPSSGITRCQYARYWWVETTRRLLQTAPETKVIAVSGLAEEPYPSLLLKAGAKGYITKGAPITEMVERLIKSCKAVNISVLILLNN